MRIDSYVTVLNLTRRLCCVSHRFDEEKKELGARKALLVKENEVKKKQLEDLEKQVDDFVAAAKAIQAKMHGPEGANATTTAPVTAAEVVADSEAMIEA